MSVLGKNCLEFINKYSVPIKQFRCSISTADGSSQSIAGYCTLPVFFKNVTRNIDFYLVPSLKQTAYLGINFWRAFALAPNIIPEINELSEETINDPNFHLLTPEQQLELEKVIIEFPSFSQSGLGCTTLLEHHIDTANATPIKSRHFPLSPPRQAEAYAEIERLLSMNVIEESNSPWCSPVVLVRKPGNKVRLCLDSRKVNAVTKKDSYPLPHIGGLLSRLKDTHFISGIDLKDAFLQIKLSEESKEKTAFAVPGKPLFQYRVMPFGLCNGPQTMSRLMDKVIPSRLRENVFIYLDDLLVCSADFETHLKILKEVAQCLKRANLTINVEKSKFCQREIKYLGYRIGHGCLKIDQDKVAAIREFPLPKTPRQIRRFIGMCNWYRSFIKNFSTMSSPLTDCIKKSVKPFKLSNESVDAFKNLKEALSTAPVLAQPDFTREFIIQCDASRVGVGGVLYQMDDNGSEHPIAFVSQKLNKCQKNYTVTELECMAAVICVKKFRPYIEGLPFRIITDHSSLRWLMNQKDLNGRLARWSLKLQGFDFAIEHRKGSLNVVPDTLSRFDVDSLDFTENRFSFDLNSEYFDCPDYKSLIESVTKNSQSLPDIIVKENKVYKRVKFRSGAEDEEDSLWRLWLPQNLIKFVVEKYHNVESCHGGYTKTLARVRQMFYWPSMAKDVKSFVDSCDTCKCIKPANISLKPMMGNAFTTSRPFQRIYCDFLGPYPRSKYQNTSLFIALDHMTKFLFLKPLRSATSINVISFFQNELFPTYGVPQFIHSDNGKQFVAKDFQEFLFKYGIKHIKTGLYSPQANASERSNREIVSKIRNFLKNDKNHQNWDKEIPTILSVLRSDYHTSIKCSPYYALFGQNMILHASSYNILEQLGCLRDDDINFQVNSDRLNKIRHKISDNIQNSHLKSSKTYNLRARKINFNEGQIVFRKNFSQSNALKAINSKFLPKYVKCKVKRKLGNSLYELEDLSGKLLGKYHASDIRP